MSLQNDLDKIRKTSVPKGWKTIEEFAREEGRTYDWTRKTLYGLYKAGVYERATFPPSRVVYYRKKQG